MAKCVSTSPTDDNNNDSVGIGSVGSNVGDDDDVCVATKSKKRKIKFVCKDGRQFR